MKIWAKIGISVLAITLMASVLLMLTGQRLLVAEELVHSGADYEIADFGNLKGNRQASLVCTYFTGRKLVTNVFWYSSNNIMGRDECPFWRDPPGDEKYGAASTGTLADWVSGIATTLATIVALAGYFWADRQRHAADRRQRQDSAYQIGYKLATLISEAATMHKALVPKGTTLDDWADVTDPFALVGAQQPVIGVSTTMVRDLSDGEQNLLMSLREEDFLMCMSETVARNQTILDALVEYKAKHEAITSKLPPPIVTSGEIASMELSQQEQNAIWPYVIPAASLLRSIRTLSAENVAMLRQMGENFHAMMRKHYPDLHIHKIEQVTDDAKVAEES